MPETESSDTKRKMKRSPSYPGIDLKEALDRCKLIYEKDKDHWANVQHIITKTWSYSNPKTGPALVALAALKKYGLLEDEGAGPKRRAKLTDLARRIIIDKRDFSSERDQAIKTAALTPGIHKEIWTEYNGSLPSNDTLAFNLQTEKNFSDRGAKEFVQQFRRTIDFAKLSQSDSISENEEDLDAMSNESEDSMDFNQNDHHNDLRGPRPNPSKKPSQNLNQQGILIPIGGGEFARLSIETPIKKEQWEQMIRVLEAMKPGLVEAEDSTT